MNRFLRLAFAALVSLFAVAAVAAPVQAAPPGCPATAICFYDTGVSSGPMEVRDREDATPGECLHLTPAADNKTSYITNRSSGAWRVYTASNCTGSPGTIYGNTSAGMSAAWNNNISSYRTF